MDNVTGCIPLWEFYQVRIPPVGVCGCDESIAGRNGYYRWARFRWSIRSYCLVDGSVVLFESLKLF